MEAKPVRWAAVGLAVVLTLGGCTAGGPGPDVPDAGPSTAAPFTTGPSSPAAPLPSLPARPRSRLAVGHRAWVTVSVATLWRSPAAPRPVDAGALARPARIRQWLAAMSVDQRRGLGGRADTQALLGAPVRVLALRSGWAEVAVPGQPSPRDRRGYPGWVPRRQLTARAPGPAVLRVTTTARTAWLRADTAGAHRVLEVSFGTSLPYRGAIGRWVRVETPDGALRRLPATAVSVHRTGDPALPATGPGLVRTARMFVGLPYLWAGRSGFGFDCSGLTSLTYEVHGTVIPRDAEPESRAGTAVAASLRRPGDLLFYAADGTVHHVTMYVGSGLMIHAPRTGAAVEVIPVGTASYAREYDGTRRYLP